MAGTNSWVRRGLVFALVGALCATFLTPLIASADTNLVVGGQAVISYANGDQVRMREDIGYEAPVIANFEEGTWVNVLDGPFTDSEGNFWYQISVGDPATAVPGYMVADFLSLDGAVSLEAVAAAEEAPAQEQTAPAIGEVIGIAYVAGTNGDGVRCRADASSAAPVISVLPEETVVEVTGGVIDIWQPVNCAGSGGFVSVEFLSWEPPAPAVVEEPEVAVPEQEAAPEQAVETPAVTGEVTGSAVVSGTNGDGVRCRVQPAYDARILTVVGEGVGVDLAGSQVGEWQPVYCAGEGGYIHASFLAEDGSAVPEAATDEVSTEAEVETAAQPVGGPVGTGSVTGTNGTGLRCRNDAGFSGAIIGVVSEGTMLDTRGSAQGMWMPVVCLGQNGFVYTDYFTMDSAGPDSNGETPANANESSSSATGMATVDTGGGGLNCRVGPSLGSNVVTVLTNGSMVDLRSGSQTDWQAVICGGQDGFVYDMYLTYDGSGSSQQDDENSDSSDTGDSGGSGASGLSGQVQITGTGGGGLRLRSDASYNASIMGVMGEGQIATVRNGSVGDWVALSWSGMNGFAHADFLTSYDGSDSVQLSNPVQDDENDAPSNSSSGLGVGSHASTTADLRLRYESNYSAGIAAVAPMGTVVEITGGQTNGFYSVDWDGLAGYMHGDYLSSTNAPLSERGGSAAPAPAPGNTQSGSVVANNMVDYAMQYVGYPYVWATHGPYSFDCSGFTSWVASNVLGMNIGYSVISQWGFGRAVGRSELAPGDVVFFENTYTWGLSHVGLYIGNNQFIHAENPSTGVRISDLNSNYYSTRFAGGRRLT